MKQCSRCKDIKENDDFSSGRGKDGLYCWCKQCCKEYREQNKLKIKTKKRSYYQKNKQEIILKTKLYNESRPIEYADYQKKYREDEGNKRKDRVWRMERQRTPRGKLNHNLRSRISQSLINKSKAGRRWESLVGFTIEQLKKHLENLFTPGMSWDNYGSYWHIDHKIPIKVFNFESPSHIDFKKCWSLENLQPLEAVKNRSKGARLERPFQPSLAM